LIRFETQAVDFSQKIVIALFFQDGRLLELYILPTGQKDNLDDLLDDIPAR
jgi:hypothetical protein